MLCVRSSLTQSELQEEGVALEAESDGSRDGKQEGLSVDNPIVATTVTDLASLPAPPRRRGSNGHLVHWSTLIPNKFLLPSIHRLRFSCP